MTKIDPNKTYRTRDGSEVRIYAVDGGAPWPVHGAVMNRELGWTPSCWCADGSVLECNDTLIDLFEVRPRIQREIWVNVYPGSASGGYIETFLTRHGSRIWYFRVKPGPRIRLPDEYGTPEFMLAYRDALAKHVSGETRTGRTLGWLVDQFKTSPAYDALARETKKQFKYQLAEMKRRAAKAPLEEITPASIAAGRDARAAKPSDANKYLKCSSALYNFAVNRQWMSSNPARGITKIQTKGQGFHTWTEEEAKRFEDRWPIGTRERLAFDLLIYTGVRRSDVVRLGKRHTRGNEITITTEKSKNMGNPIEVTIGILPPLARSIAATPTGVDTYLATAKGAPFVKEGFGNWFRDACREAKVPGAAHGLRKLAAVRMAEAGATNAELEAVFGWVYGSSEAALYVEKANRKKLAQAGIVRMLSQPNSQTEEKEEEIQALIEKMVGPPGLEPGTRRL